MPVLPTTAYSQAEDALTLARARKRHLGRGFHGHAADAAVEPAAQHLLAFVGIAGRQDQSNWRDVIYHPACALRKSTADPDAGDRSGADSFGHRCAGICHGGAGGAITRGASTCGGSAGCGADRHREFDQSLHSSGADHETAEEALRIPPGRRLPLG